MLQEIGKEHWDKRRANDSLSYTPQISPVEGKADDGVRDVPVHVLVVTHGAYMRVAVKYFVEELNCPIPQDSNKAHMLSLSPNTGLCRFVVTLEKEEDRFSLSQISCVFIHRADHVKMWKEAALHHTLKIGYIPPLILCFIYRFCLHILFPVLALWINRKHLFYNALSPLWD